MMQYLNGMWTNYSGIGPTSTRLSTGWTPDRRLSNISRLHVILGQQVFKPDPGRIRRFPLGLDRGMHIAQFVLRGVAPTFSVDPVNRARHGGDAGAACRAVAHAHARPSRLGRWR